MSETPEEKNARLGAEMMAAINAHNLRAKYDVKRSFEMRGAAMGAAHAMAMMTLREWLANDDLGELPPEIVTTVFKSSSLTKEQRIECARLFAEFVRTFETKMKDA